MRLMGPIGREYVDVEYDQFAPTKSTAWLRTAATSVATVLMLPLFPMARHSDYVFRTMSEILAIVPFVFGIALREAFYRSVLDRCGKNLLVEFGTTFHYRDVRIGDNVLISGMTTIHHCDIGDNVLVGEGCRLLSGRRQHRYDRTDTPMNRQGGQMKRIQLSDDVWIGDNAVIMNDVRRGAIVAAGSVVIHPVESYTICGGNPARVLRHREPPQ